MAKTCLKKAKREKQVGQCRICGDGALHSYFGVISCEPCKMFFKRNAEQKQELLQCKYNGDCEINVNNRHVCSHCRLRKCLTSGMRVEMIRGTQGKTNKRSRKRKLITDQKQDILTAMVKSNALKQFPTLNLLQADHSTLSIDQWNLISNLSHCFDEHSGLAIGEKYMCEQMILPLKSRFKSASFIQYLHTSLEMIQFVYKNNQDFLSLCPNDRTTLLQITSQHIGGLTANFIHHQIGLTNYPAFYDTMALISHPSIVTATKRVQDRLNFDLITMKLFLAILAFSTTSSTFYSHTSPGNLSNIQQILHIQNLYVELLWKYLVYKYTFQGAVLCFSDLMRCLFALHDALVQAQNLQWFTEKMDSIVESTKQTLIIKD